MLLNFATKLKNAKRIAGVVNIILNILWYFAVVAVEPVLILSTYQVLVFIRVCEFGFYFFLLFEFFQLTLVYHMLSTGGQAAA